MNNKSNNEEYKPKLLSLSLLILVLVLVFSVD